MSLARPFKPALNRGNLAGGKMEGVIRTTQAYSQAPWRKQLQIAVLFLVCLILVAVVAAVYLNVTAQAVTMGTDIQNMQWNIEQLKRTNDDLQTQLAYLTSDSTMQSRAQKLGFKQVQPDQIIYIKVPGYPGREPAVMAPPAGPAISNAVVMSPEYSQSLLDWFEKNVLQPAGLVAEVRP
jgi:cell division protein FtsL